MNPVLARETKERFRGKRVMPWMLTVWILAIGLIGYLLFVIARLIARDSFGLGPALSAGFMGRFLFESMTILLVTAVVMVIPGLSALAIVGERERQTFHLLQVTQMTPVDLILGKLTASIAYFFILIVAVLPIVGLPLVFGGLDMVDVAVAIGFISLLAVMLASVSTWMSARAKSSRGAVAMSYTISFAFAFLTFAGMGAEYFFALDDFGRLPEEGVESYSALMNPYLGLVSAVSAPLELGQETFFATPFRAGEAHLFQRQDVGAEAVFGGGGIAPGAVRIENGRQFVNYSRPPLWVYTVVVYLAVTGYALRRAAAIVAAPAVKTVRVKQRRKRGSREAADAAS